MGDLTLIRQQYGFINGGTMTILVGGLVLGVLLVHSLKSGQAMPLWPAVVVCLVNLIAAVKIILDVKKARRLRQSPPEKNVAKRPVRRNR